MGKAKCIASYRGYKLFNKSNTERRMPLVPYELDRKSIITIYTLINSNDDCFRGHDYMYNDVRALVLRVGEFSPPISKKKKHSYDLC